jgi:hypothetical protein
MAQFESIRFQPQRPLLRELSAERLNAILAEIRRNRPRAGGGISVRQSGDGTYITLAAKRGKGGGASPTQHPFQLLSVTENNTNKIRVRYGTINGVAPTGMSLGDDPPYLLTPNGTTGVVYAVATFDRSNIAAPATSRNLGLAALLPEDDENAAHLEIGSWSTNQDGGLILAQAVTASLFVDPFGFTFLWGNV